MRECGNCSACCDGWIANRIAFGDEVIEVYPGQHCRHCSGTGCSIYEDRPQSPCREFSCMWLERESEFPEEMRPDRSGAIVVEDMPFADWDVITAIPVGLEIPDLTLNWLRLYSNQLGLPLVYNEREEVDGKLTGLGRQSYYGPDAFIDAVRNQIQPSDVMKFN